VTDCKHKTLCFLLAVALSLPVSVWAVDEEPAMPGLCPTMSWNEIHQAMERYPPSFENGDEQDRAKLKPWLQKMVPFYRRRSDRCLDALASTRVAQGVRLFKFCSSSVILKNAQGTVSLDFCQGPINNGGEPEASDPYESGFYLTPTQRDRLAKLVDLALITHRHHDHADFSLAKRLVAAGKPVIGPAQLKRQWPGLAHGITVPQYNTAQRFGPCEIRTQFGYQYPVSQKGSDGERYGMHDADAIERSSETVRYLLRMGGITFLQSAESHTKAYDWLVEAEEQGWSVDVLFKPGQYQGARSVLRYLKGRDYFQVSIHEYELMHHGGGNRTAQLLQGGARAAFDRKRAMPLLWGEDFLLTLPEP
jgi:L-ascorbate metabolism protein UlaG (beta-lactamase superfamily)